MNTFLKNMNMILKNVFMFFLCFLRRADGGLCATCPLF